MNRKPAVLLYVAILAFMLVAMGSCCHYQDKLGKAAGPAAQYTLTITFRGLVTFVPENPQGGTTYGDLWALLAAADGPSLAPLPTAAHPPEGHIPTHQAFIKVSAANLYGAVAAGTVYLALGSADAWAPKVAMPPDRDGHDITFDPPLDTGNITLNNFNQVVPLDIVGHPRVCANCLDKQLNPDPLQRPPVAARVRFAGGSATPGNLIGNYPPPYKVPVYR
jgi:hypothetical protein